VRPVDRAQVVPVSIEQAFTFFSNPWNLAAITPPWLRFQIVAAPEELAQGSLLAYRLRLFGIPIGWRTRIEEWRPPHGFTDVQLQGPWPWAYETSRRRPLPTS
jgi:ligand-binding SRPBCC domain-containing protein